MAKTTARLVVIGMTVSGISRMLMARIAREKTLPFDSLVPNAETVEAMQAARRGETVKVRNRGGLIASLNAGDR